MAHFTDPENLNSRDEFLDNADFSQDDWELSAPEELDFDPEEDTWNQVGLDDLDFDELDDLDEDMDDFNGVF